MPLANVPTSLQLRVANSPVIFIPGIGDCHCFIPRGLWNLEPISRGPWEIRGTSKSILMFALEFFLTV